MQYDEDDPTSGFSEEISIEEIKNIYWYDPKRFNEVISKDYQRGE